MSNLGWFRMSRDMAAQQHQHQQPRYYHQQQATGAVLPPGQWQQQFPVMGPFDSTTGMPPHNVHDQVIGMTATQQQEAATVPQGGYNGRSPYAPPMHNAYVSQSTLSQDSDYPQQQTFTSLYMPQSQQATPPQLSPGHPHQDLSFEANFRLTPPLSAPQSSSGYTQQHIQMPTPPKSATPTGAKRRSRNQPEDSPAVKRQETQAQTATSAQKQVTAAQHGSRTSNVNQAVQGQTSPALPPDHQKFIAEYGWDAYEAVRTRQQRNARHKQQQEREAQIKQHNEARAAEARRQEQQKAAGAQRAEQARAQQAGLMESRRQAQRAIIDAENKKRAAAAQAKLAKEHAAAQKELYEQRLAAQKQLAREHAVAQEKFAEEQAAAQRTIIEERAAAQKACEEQLRAHHEAKLEAERKAARKEELRKDPSTLYRHYYEYITYFPIPKGERMNSYCMTLLANRKTIGIEPDSDTGLAIQYAKDHWQFFLTNKDQYKATEWQKEKLEKLKADAPVTSMTNKAGKV
jgi:hypothetical protein